MRSVRRMTNGSSIATPNAPDGAISRPKASRATIGSSPVSSTSPGGVCWT